MNEQLIYKLEGVSKTVTGPSEELSILSGVNLEVGRGESLAVLGASGSGKSTLLHILGTLEDVSDGRISFRGRDLRKMSALERAEVRNREIGFVFQFHHLLPEFDTLENVAMPGLIAGLPRSEALGKAEEALERVGLSERLRHRVTTLSGGERQRAAIARAMLLSPGVLLTDEPTGNLDPRTGARIAELLMTLNRETGMTLIMVTHNHELAGLMNRRLELRSGELYDHT